MPAGDRVAEEGLHRRDIPGHHARDQQLRRHHGRHQGVPFARWGVDQVPSVQVQQVEEEGRERYFCALTADIDLAADPAGGDLEWLWPPAWAQRDYFPVEHQGVRVEGPHRVGDLGDPGGDVVERSREHADLAASPVDLDPDPVDLPLGRGHGQPFEGRGNAGRRRGEHRAQRPTDLQANGAQRGRGGRGPRARQRDLRHPRERPAQQEGPADLLGGHSGRAGHGLDHEAFKGTLVQFTRDQPDQERALTRRGPFEQGRQQPAPVRLGAGPGGRADRREDGVCLGQRDGRLRSTSLVAVSPGRALRGGRVSSEQVAEGRVAHADLPLAQFAGEKCHRHGDFGGAGPAQQGGDLVGFGPASGRSGNRSRRAHQFLQKHTRHCARRRRPSGVRPDRTGTGSEIRLGRPRRCRPPVV